MAQEEILRRSGEEGQKEQEKKGRSSLARKGCAVLSPVVVLASFLFLSRGYIGSWAPFALTLLLCVLSLVYEIRAFAKVRRVWHLPIAALGFAAIIWSLKSLYVWYYS